MTIAILAALEKGGEQWDPQQLGERILQQTTVGTLYKRVSELSKAQELIETDEKWGELRFLIVSHASVLNAIDPNEGTISSVSIRLNKIREKFAFKVYTFAIIGVSIGDMYGKSLMRSGCDITCASNSLPELILELLQPRSGRIKLPDDL